MRIVTIRTDKPEAEIGLYEDKTQIIYEAWHAHRQLAETLHGRIIQLMYSQKLEISDIEGIVCYEGPGSFTGLRIGLTVANAIAYSNQIPIIAIPDKDNAHWRDIGIQRLLAGESDSMALPKYGAPAIITIPKK